MISDFALDKRIRLYGNKKEIDRASEVLKQITNLSSLSEGKARLEIQRLIDLEKLKASILFDGNTVYSKDRILKNLRQIKKAKVLGSAGYRFVGNIRFPEGNGKPVLSKYFYNFLNQCCGSIAHYNIYGWIVEYPTVEDLRNFFKKNEFGNRVLNHLPEWHTDAREIASEIERILDSEESETDWSIYVKI